MCDEGNSRGSVFRVGAVLAEAFRGNELFSFET